MVSVQIEKLSPQERHALIQRGEALVKSNGKNEQMLLDLASLYIAEDKNGQAAEHALRAYKLNRRNPLALSLLVNCYNSLAQHKEARKFGRKLVELSPRNRDYLTVYAQTLEFGQSYSLALEVWNKLIKIYPQEISFLHEKANCLRMMGRIEDANKALCLVLEQDPHNPEALYYYANSKKFEAEEAHSLLPQMKSAFEKTTQIILKSNLAYAIGKVLGEAGLADEAFEYYIKANNLRETDEQEDFRWVENIETGFGRSLFKAKAELGNASEAPIFILGMVRSGTTLTESLIGAHSRVTAGDEQPYLTRMCRSMGMFSAQPAAFEDLLKSLTRRNLEELCDHYLESTREIRRKTPYFTDKMPHNFQAMGLIRLLFPNAKIIHCRRHPIDNCVSIFTNSMIELHNKYKNNLQSLGLYYRQYLRVMEHWRRELPGGFHEVYYEDLVTNTEAVTGEMLDYLGLEVEELSSKRQESQKGVRTLSAWQVRQPVFTSSMGRWRQYENHLGPLIDALGSCVEEYEAEIAKLAKESSSK